MSRGGGWSMVWLGASVVLALSVIDRLYGEPIGVALAKWTINLFN